MTEKTPPAWTAEWLAKRAEKEEKQAAPATCQPVRDLSVASPLPLRYLTVVPLQSLQRYYGEVTVW